MILLPPDLKDFLRLLNLNVIECQGNCIQHSEGRTAGRPGTARCFDTCRTSSAKFLSNFLNYRHEIGRRCGIKEIEINHINIITAYVGLGSNLGDRQSNLKIALSEMRALPMIEVKQVSSLYESAPVGMTEQPDFLNAVAEVQTSLPALELLGVLLHIEKKMGRARTIRWGPRVIDLDLLLYGEQQIALPNLTVPHPRLRERAFVMVPLAELAPELALPGGGKTAAEIADFFSGSGNILRRGVV